MERDRNAGTPEFWTGVLNLEGFEVVAGRHERRTQTWHFTVVPLTAWGTCPQCGRASTQRHQTRDRERIHDLPLGDSRVELTVRVFQYECEPCGRCFTPACDALAEGTPWPKGRMPPSGSSSARRPWSARGTSPRPPRSSGSRRRRSSGGTMHSSNGGSRRPAPRPPSRSARSASMNSR